MSASQLALKDKEQKMTAKARELLDMARLQDAIGQATDEVRSDPSDAAKRTMLFELLCFAGEWTRAGKQLDVIGHQSVQAELGVMIYRALIKGEIERRRLFKEGIHPHFLKEPPPYIDLNLAAINAFRQGKMAEAHDTLERAEEERPAISGKLDGRTFGDFRDSDDFVAPILELIIKDRYVWMPVEHVKSLKVAPPRQLRDLLWCSAHVEALDGTIAEVYLPALYEGTSEDSDDQVRLGRSTDWRDHGEGVYRSVGLRMFRIDEDEKSLFEIGELEFDSTEAAVNA